ncbi:MAG TPA: Hpt domain-containing protein [Candidatus Wallbacteria bacterium]|nr:MAG: Hpt domain protein [bacterium ADurb.Bin243]HPG57284.1 Hpt domain-containing protein [Candidatus Wallbacteria bacterium]
MEELKTFDAEKFMKHVLNKKDLANEIINIFFEDLNMFMGIIRSSIESGDYATLRKTAHRLKGSSINVSAEKLSALFFKLETIGKANSIVGANAVLDELFTEIEGFKAEISSWKTASH